MIEKVAVMALPPDAEEDKAPSAISPRPGIAGRNPRKTLLLWIDAATLNRQCAIQALQAGAEDLEIVGLARPEELAPEAMPDIVLFNIHGMAVDEPWIAEGLALIRSRTAAPIVLLSSAIDGRSTLHALSRGVRGVVPATLDIGMLLAAVRLVVAGGTFVPNEVVTNWASPVETRSPPRDALFMGFTPREVQVLEKLKEGKFNKIIAYELNISESTVKIHVRHIMRKLNASNRTQVVHLLQSRENRLERA